MPTLVEMIGKKFGRLTVLEMVGERVSGRHPKWKCVCDCGDICIKSAIALRTGNNPSCGCATGSLCLLDATTQKQKTTNIMEKGILPFAQNGITLNSFCLTWERDQKNYQLTELM